MKHNHPRWGRGRGATGMEEIRKMSRRKAEKGTCTYQSSFEDKKTSRDRKGKVSKREFKMKKSKFLTLIYWK
jgi:hypothetical protein